MITMFSEIFGILLGIVAIGLAIYSMASSGGGVIFGR